MSFLFPGEPGDRDDEQGHRHARTRLRRVLHVKEEVKRETHPWQRTTRPWWTWWLWASWTTDTRDGESTGQQRYVESVENEQKSRLRLETRVVGTKMGGAKAPPQTSLLYGSRATFATCKKQIICAR